MSSKLPHPGAVIRKYRELSGLTLEAVAQAAGSTTATISRIEHEKQRPSPATIERLASALGIDVSRLMAGDVSAVEHDPTAPDPEPPEELARAGGSSLLRSLPIASYIDAAGDVTGDLAIDVIKRPTGKSSDTLKRQHAMRSAREPKQYVEIDAIPPDAELVRAEAPIDLRDTGETIGAGHLLVVARGRPPQDERLVLAKRDMGDQYAPVKPGEALERAGGVRLWRYHAAGRGWTLEPIDGSGRNVGPGDGWEIVAAVLWWRSPP